MWDILSGAPWWVYVLFICLMFVGVEATKTRTVAVRRLVIFPLVFVIWSLFNLYHHVIVAGNALIVYWIVFLLVGTYCGKKEVQSWKLRIDRNKGQITIPGSYSTIVLILVIFVLRFVWGYYYATKPHPSHWIYVADTITSALFTGFFVGRSFVFLKRYMNS